MRSEHGNKMEAQLPYWAIRKAAEAQVREAANEGACYLFTLRWLHYSSNNWLQEASQEVINHFTWSLHGPDAGNRWWRWGFAANLASLKQSQGEKGNCCRQCLRLHCAYLEVVIRVSVFIIPGISCCWWLLRELVSIKTIKQRHTVCIFWL